MQIQILLALVLALPACATASLPPKKVTSKVWRFAVISDLNRSYGSKEYSPEVDRAIQAITHSPQAPFSFVISTGDMVAGQKAGLDYSGMWRAFHERVTLPLQQSGLPLLPSAGNHDASASRGFAVEREHYRNTWANFAVDRFNSSREASEQIQFLSGVEQNYPFYYAVTIGPALLISLDATVPRNFDSRQYEWLQRVLALSAPYTLKVVFGHVPLYPFALGRASEFLGSPRLEALLEQNKVDLFLSGHHHAYYQGHRNGHMRYVSVPLLGSGARKLMTRSRSERNTGPLAFLVVEFDESGKLDIKAYRPSTMAEFPVSSLPASISVPSSSSSDCSGCGSFNRDYFIDRSNRILFHRAQ